MPTYVSLVNWTEQGVRSVTETRERAEQVRQMVEQMGGRMDTLLWTQGRYDLVGFDQRGTGRSHRRRAQNRNETPMKGPVSSSLAKSSSCSMRTSKTR